MTARHFSTACGPRRRLFRMQIGRATPRHESVEPILEGGTSRQSPGHDITSERLRFHDCDIWLARNGNQIISGAPANVPGRTPMKWKGNLMDRFSADLKRPGAATDERTRFNRTAQGDDAYVIAILDLEFGGELRRNFCEHFRL